MNSNEQEGFSNKIRWGGWINVALATVSVLILACVANYLAHRHFDRTSWSQNLNRKLSTRTVELLKDLGTNKVRIIIFFDKTDPNYQMTEELLKQYVHKNENLMLTTVDPEVQSAKARDILKQYRLTPQQRNVVIFDANGKSRVVTNGQLTTRKGRPITEEELKELPEDQRAGLVYERTAFLGERQFTSAIQAVSSKDQPIIYCVKGHGEHSITNHSSNGYSEFGKMLGEMNAVVYDFELNRATAIPSKCDLLVLPGPITALNTKEKRMVEQYLSSQGGRMLILLNHRSHGDLKELLERWGVTVGNNTIQDGANTLVDGSLTLRRYSHHPVVLALKREDLPVRLLLPRTVSALPKEEQLAAAGLEVTSLITTSTKGKAIRNLINRKQGVPPVLEIENAALSLAVAVEKDTLTDVQTDHLARIVVVGDSIFLSNRMIDRDRNRELGWHTVNWLLDRSHLMRGIGPKQITSYRFEFRQTEFRKLASLVVGIMPAATVLFGLMVWLRRRA
jgi:hypothetical protein